MTKARGLLERLLELRDVAYEMVVDTIVRSEAAKRDYSKSTRERDRQQGIADTARAVRVYLEDEGDVHSVAEARAYLAQPMTKRAEAPMTERESLQRLESVTRSYLRYPLEGEEPGYSAEDVLAYCDEALAALDLRKNGDPHGRCPPRAPCGQYSAEEATEPCAIGDENDSARTVRVFLTSRELWRIVDWSVSQTSCAAATQAIVDHDTVSTRAREKQIKRMQRDRKRR